VTGDACVSGTLSVPTINGKDGSNVMIVANVDLDCKDLSNVATLEVETINEKAGGDGTIGVGASLVPTPGNVHNLGSETNKWEEAWVNDLYVCGDATIAGNLTISGTRTYANTTTVEVGDNVLVVNSGPQGLGLDAGVYICRYQVDNDAGTGPVTDDTPAFCANIAATTGIGGSTANLGATASGSDDSYNDWWIKITNGEGTDEIRKIVDYDGTTKVATLSNVTTVSWETTSEFCLYPCTYVGWHYDEATDKLVYGCTANVNAEPITNDYFSTLCTGTIDPGMDQMYDLGSPDKKWDTLYVADIEMCGNIVGANIEGTDACYESLQVNCLTSKPTGGTLTIKDDVDLFCQTLANVESLDVNTVNPKDVGGNVTVTSNVEVTGDVNATGDFNGVNACLTGNLSVDTICSKTGNVEIKADGDCNHVEVRSNAALKLEVGKISYYGYGSVAPAQEKYINQVTTAAGESANIVCVPLDCPNSAVMIDAKVTSFSSTGNVATYSIQRAFKNDGSVVGNVGSVTTSQVFCDPGTGEAEYQIYGNCACLTVTGDATDSINWCAVTEVYYWQTCDTDPCDNGVKA
jgi:hypothetical protein